MNSKYRLAPTQLLLPRLTHLEHISSLEIKAALDTLCALYFPYTLSASHIITDTLSTVFDSTHTQLPAFIPFRQQGIEAAVSVPDSGYASAEEDDDLDIQECQAGDSAISAIYSDPSERAYAIKWLTGFVGRSDIWLSPSLPNDGENEALREELVEQAAQLINAFSGDIVSSPANDGAKDGDSISRSFSFSTSCCVLSTAKVSIQLNDAPVSSSDHTSVGLQSWGSSIILTERICADPFAFAILTRSDGPAVPSPPLRILELGAGTGLLSIAIFKMLHLHSCSAEIVATDYHPDVLTNLSYNVYTNCSEAGTNSSSITVHAFNWEHPDYSCPPFDAPFDLILAADVVYHPSHAGWIKSCVEQLLLKPSGQRGFLWLIVPVRTTGRHEGMQRTVEDVFPIGDKSDTGDCKLHILELEAVPRREGIGRADESGYRIYKIGRVLET